MNIFVTGVAGFLGSNLADYLIKQGHYVAGIDDLSGGLFCNVNNKVSFRKVDLTTPVDLWWKNFEGFDVVYHCAAAPYEGVSVFSPGYICDNIFSASVNVFTAAIKAGVERIVYCSSMARYGRGVPPFNEYDIPTPQDPYGIAKEASERVLKNLAEVHGIEYVIAVPHNIYGPKQYYFDPYRNVASIFINATLQGIRPIIYGDGRQKRSFSYISDCVEPLAKMAFNSNVVGETINIGPDNNEITINDLYNTVCQITGFTDYPIYMPDRPKEVKIAHCSSDKARKLLDYDTKVDLISGLENLTDWIIEQGPKPFNYDKLQLEIINNKTPKNWTDRILK